MKFVMEKGEVAFTNFDQGYKHFHTLTLNQKIKFILDLAESLITLQEHGINHNDITIRNSVLVNNRFKFIDFDVARMVDIDFDYSPYSSS
jgi:tRNA A-37 threonylcarbamoyl transferase component Bud32